MGRASKPLRLALRPEVFPDSAEPLRTALHDFITTSPASSPEGILEDLYLRARMHRFGGRNITTTGLFCRQGLPYFGNELVDLILGLPYDHKRRGWVVRQGLLELSPELGRVDLSSGIPVHPPSLARPNLLVQEALVLSKKLFWRLGGPVARRLGGVQPGNVPWDAVRANKVFREFVRDTIRPKSMKATEFLDEPGVVAITESALAGGPLFPLGLLLTLELTLRVPSGPAE
jgi:hypothetical protein